MSPELLDPEAFGLKISCPTKESDCYALGMVIYEVLSGQVPFPQCKGHTFLLKVMGGERLERPQGAQGTWFTDELWEFLERCWKRQPHERPSLDDILQYLEGVARPFRSRSPTLVMDKDVTAGIDDPLDLTLTALGAFSVSSEASG